MERISAVRPVPTDAAAAPVSPASAAAPVSVPRLWGSVRSTSATTPKDSALSRNAATRPPAAMSSPASAGPMK